MRPQLPHYRKAQRLAALQSQDDCALKRRPGGEGRNDGLPFEVALHDCEVALLLPFLKEMVRDDPDRVASGEVGHPERKSVQRKIIPQVGVDGARVNGNKVEWKDER